MAIAPAVYQPCLRAFLFPFGAPGNVPPCIRHRPFFIAADRHGLPLLGSCLSINPNILIAKLLNRTRKQLDVWCGRKLMERQPIPPWESKSLA